MSRQRTIKYQFPLNDDAFNPDIHSTIQFTCKNKDNPKAGAENAIIQFPIPAGITFSMEANYGTIDVKGGGEGDGKGLKAENIAAAMAQDFTEKFIDNAGGERALELAKFNTKKVINQNTNTIFESNGIRSFTFDFDVLPESYEESKIISDISRYCSKNIYATEADNNTELPGNYLLNFPSKWTIKFLFNGSLNPWLPGIYKCYLTSFSETINSQGSTFFEDGSPMSRKFSFSFQETKVLTYSEIAELNKNKRLREPAADANSLVDIENIASLNNVFSGGFSFNNFSTKPNINNFIEPLF